MLALAFLLAWLIKFVAAERAMQQVAMAGAAMPMQPPGSAPAPAPPIPAPAASGEPAYLTDDAESGAAATPAAASIVPPADKPPAQATAKPRQARVAETPPRPAEKQARLARSDTPPPRRTGDTERRRLEDRTGTFRRCPPLGKEGAVTCRWHICNGAAGKEAACRPYLERRP